MVGKAGKRLCTYNIIDAAVDKFHHFSGKEPSLTCLVSDGNDVLCIAGSLVNAYRGREVAAFCEGFGSAAPQEFKGAYAGL